MSKQAKETLQKKLKEMEEKLLIGGMIMDKAAKQEADLRRAEYARDKNGLFGLNTIGGAAAVPA